MARREFPKSVQVEIIKRATRNGVVYCEGCGLPTRRWNIDHIIADALVVDKSKRLTAAEGQLLCSGSRDTCHGRKTAEVDIPANAKAKRREAKNLGVRIAPAKKIESAPFPKSAKVRVQRQSLPPRPMFIEATHD